MRNSELKRKCKNNNVHYKKDAKLPKDIESKLPPNCLPLHKLDHLIEKKSLKLALTQKSDKKKWTPREKKALLVGIKQYGFDDLNKLEEIVETRTAAEVKTLINYYKKTSKCVTHQDTKIVNLDKWQKLIYHRIRDKGKAQDLSVIISQIFEDMSKQDFPSPIPSCPNFKNVYKHLSDMLAGKVPYNISDNDSWALDHMFQFLENLVQTIPLNEEKHFLKNWVQLFASYQNVGKKNTFRNMCINERASKLTSDETVAIDEMSFIEVSSSQRFMFDHLNPMAIKKKILLKEQEAVYERKKDSSILKV